MQDSVSFTWDGALLSKISFATIDDPNVLAQALAFESEAKWYPSVLSAMLCQQGFLFDSLAQNDKSKMCFEAACLMLPVNSEVGTNVHELFLKMILRNRLVMSQTRSSLDTIPETFERVPGLQCAFDDYSVTGDSCAKGDGFRYMNITGWMSFCAKYRFHIFFPTLIRSKCIECFMDTAKKSYGKTLLLSFVDFCSCLLQSRDAGMFQDSAARTSIVSEAARVAAVVAFLEAAEFFVSKKHPVQRKLQKFFSSAGEFCNLTTNIELPILRSILENQSETWSLNCSEIIVANGLESENIETAVSQSASVTFRAPFALMMPLEDTSLSSGISNVLAFSTARVSSVAFLCACVKLNRPVLTKQGGSYALHLMNIRSKIQPLITSRVIQIIAIATIQQALCCSDATRTKAFFDKYHHQIRHISDDLEKKKLPKDHLLTESKSIFGSNNQVAPVSKTKIQEQGQSRFPQSVRCGQRVHQANRTKLTNNARIPDASQLSPAMPELPAEIIRFRHDC